LAGDASGQDCTIMSSGVSGSHSDIVRERVDRKRTGRLDWGKLDWAGRGSAEAGTVALIAYCFPVNTRPGWWLRVPFQTGVDRLRPV